MDGYFGSVTSAGFTIAELVVHACALILFHRSALDLPQEGAAGLFRRNAAFNRFVWTYLGFIAVWAIPLIVAVVALSIAGYQFGIFVAVVGFIGFAWVLVAMFGTVFPAIVDGADKTLAAAYQRGRLTGGRLMFDLFVWFCLAYVVVFGFWMILAFAFSVPISAIADDGSFSVVGLIVNLLMVITTLFPTALGVAALCKAYRRAEAANAHEAGLTSA